MQKVYDNVFLRSVSRGDKRRIFCKNNQNIEPSFILYILLYLSSGYFSESFFQTEEHIFFYKLFRYIRISFVSFVLLSEKNVNRV